MRGYLKLFLFFVFHICVTCKASDETVYFLVGEVNPQRNDCYVLPLSEPNDIAHARDLIEFGTAIGEPIVVASIDCNIDGINRNYFAPGKPAWSWHVTDFVTFANTTAEILDGWPGMVHEDCQGWTGGSTIGFWSYTVVAELGCDPYHWVRDFDHDSNITNNDFACLANEWMRQDCNDANWWCNGRDLDKDGTVDYNDFKLFAESWLSPFAEAPLWFYAWDCPTQCHGDATCGGRVDAGDVIILRSSIGTHYGDGWYNPGADFDRDLDVDENDAAILDNWFMEFPPSDCPAAPF